MRKLESRVVEKISQLSDSEIALNPNFQAYEGSLQLIEDQYLAMQRDEIKYRQEVKNQFAELFEFKNKTNISLDKQQISFSRKNEDQYREIAKLNKLANSREIEKISDLAREIEAMRKKMIDLQVEI